MTRPTSGDRPYEISWAEYRRQTPRVYGDRRAPGEEPDPGNTTAYVEEPKIRPSANTIEGMLSDFGSAMSAAAGQTTARQQRLTRWAGRIIVGVVALPIGLGVVGALFHWW